MHRRLFSQLFAALVLAGTASFTLAQTPAPANPTLRLRGTITALGAGSFTMLERGGETITLKMAPNMPITEVLPIELSAIQPNSYIGTAAVPGPDGNLQALEVHVFPEASRGTGEGHRPMDIQPQATMTNATVADVAALVTGTAAGGRVIKLKYKDGEKTVTVPPGVPVVTFQPGDMGLIVVGAKVSVIAESRDGLPTALRVNAGRNGFTPPL